MSGPLTPIRRQYLEIKKRYPEAIVFFRLGDFYETFDEDAKVASRELEITLTSKPMGKDFRVPLAGIPYHSVDSYLARLIGRGYKVAVVEQLTDPATSKGLVDRDVVRVVTPGTVVEPNMLESRANNYLTAVVVDGARAGLAYVDVTTGEFSTTQVNLAQLGPELERLGPAEILIPEGAEHPDLSPPAIRTPLEAWRFDLDAGRQALLEHFGVATLEGYGCAGLPLAVRAAGAVVAYLQETQRGSLGQITQLSTYSLDAFMVLDVQTRRNLELTQTTRTGAAHGSLISVLDVTRTPMGGRLLRRWVGQPLLDLDRLLERQESVQFLFDDALLRAEIAALLAQLVDVERLANRILMGVATPRDVVALRHSLEVIPRLRDALGGREGRDRKGGREGRDGADAEAVARLPLPPEADGGEGDRLQVMAGPDPIERLLLQLDPCGELAQLVIRALVDEPPASLADAGVIRPGYSAELDNLIASASQARQYVAGLERTERERTGVRSLKVGYNKVFGYYIEVTNPSLDTVLPDHVRARRSLLDNGEAAVPCACQTHREHLERCLGYVRKQTLVGAERFITSDLKEYESIILNAQERQVEMETALFRDLCTQIGAQAGRVLETASALAHLDVFSSLAEVASRNGYVRPQLDDGSGLRIVGGRHPVVERTLTETRFVPNDLSLSSEDCQVMVLTGPNMAGKSTYILTAALIVLMAQIGSFVPAESAALGLVDRVFTRVGAQHDIAAGQSTFLVEMSETANILNHATPRSLLVLDEIGRGTSTYDGLSIARAVVEFIHNHPRLGCKTLFATHYHELTEVEKYLPRVRNFRMDVLEEGNKVVFLHRVVPGGADRSYGIHVARLAGIPRAVTRRAEEILRDLENGGHDRRGRRETRRPRAEPTPQLPLFAEPHPAFQELATLDVASMTPLEAITKLFELQQKAKGNG